MASFIRCRVRTGSPPLLSICHSSRSMVYSLTCTGGSVAVGRSPSVQAHSPSPGIGSTSLASLCAASGGVAPSSPGTEVPQTGLRRPIGRRRRHNQLRARRSTPRPRLRTTPRTPSLSSYCASCKIRRLLADGKVERGYGVSDVLPTPPKPYTAIARTELAAASARASSVVKAAVLNRRGRLPRRGRIRAHPRHKRVDSHSAAPRTHPPDRCARQAALRPRTARPPRRHRTADLRTSPRTGSVPRRCHRRAGSPPFRMHCGSATGSSRRRTRSSWRNFR